MTYTGDVTGGRAGRRAGAAGADDHASWPSGRWTTTPTCCAAGTPARRLLVDAANEAGPAARAGRRRAAGHRRDHPPARGPLAGAGRGGEPRPAPAPSRTRWTRGGMPVPADETVEHGDPVEVGRCDADGRSTCAGTRPARSRCATTTRTGTTPPVHRRLAVPRRPGQHRQGPAALRLADGRPGGPGLRRAAPTTPGSTRATATTPPSAPSARPSRSGAPAAGSRPAPATRGAPRPGSDQPRGRRSSAGADGSSAFPVGGANVYRIMPGRARRSSPAGSPTSSTSRSTGGGSSTCWRSSRTACCRATRPARSSGWTAAEASTWCRPIWPRRRARPAGPGGVRQQLRDVRRRRRGAAHPAALGGAHPAAPGGRSRSVPRSGRTGSGTARPGRSPRARCRSCRGRTR